MTTMQKFKAYFGMVPPSDFDDEYFAEADAPQGMSARERAYMEKYRSNGTRGDEFYGDEPFRDRDYRDADYRDAEYREPYSEPEPRLREPAPRYREAAYREAEMARPMDDRAFVPRMEADRPYVGRRAAEPEPVRRLEPLTRSANVTVRGANAVALDPQIDVDPQSENAMKKISKLRPRDYSEARTIGERFRDGSPVIMDLADMSNEEAKRLVDFAAGLVFAMRGSFDKVATKVFLLSPSGVDVTPEERTRIAESGFFNQA
ncbi:cell division protein SepF [Gordonia hydrophobica]|uniref:Cell division protein SepF n=1 Tax=Gordonia hydrophobica TaxID=40516 RepID=A0ABZ2TYL7_9ACTN|nr:cell division protein SepF [Gordonia hydrophobica]MBM7367120.1 cell division inhibitor SepF [Gordonia hydrophobica]